MEEQRHQNALRDLVDKKCKGLMPHLQDRIKDVARRAYYLGCNDGMQLADEVRKRDGEAA